MKASWVALMRDVIDSYAFDQAGGDANTSGPASKVQTEVNNENADVQAFLNMPMVGLPENSQILHSELIHPSAYDDTSARLCTRYWQSG